MKRKNKRISNILTRDVKSSKNVSKRITNTHERDENRNDDNNNNINNNDNNIVPVEIDSHFQMYGKRAYEVEYGERCPLCNRRIDEYGFCACGSGGE
jgi:hypothetical protein